MNDTQVIYHQTIFPSGQKTNIAKNINEIIPAYFSIHSHAFGETILTNLYPSKGTMGIRLKAANQKLMIEKYAKKCET